MVEMQGSQTPTSYFQASSASKKEKSCTPMRRKLSFETRIVIGSAIFAFASSAFLHLIPATPPNPNLRGKFVNYGGNAYYIVVKYPINELQSAKLFEDGQPLGPANSELQDIASKGKGRYRLSRQPDETVPVLMFSTSDNSDPNTNGRKYRLE
ncbi:hypothetical protein ACVILK_001160 [Bradyrhizobium embrapense]